VVVVVVEMELVMELGAGIDRAEMCQGDFDLEY
jgi:hypothetical protein